MSDDYIGGTAPSSTMPDASSGFASAPTPQSSRDDENGAKARAKETASAASEAGSKVLDEARGGASDVKAEAQHQARDLWAQARSELTDQSSAQQQRLAGGLRSFSDQLHQMADAPDEQGVATDLARQLGTRAADIGRWLEDRGPDDVIEELRSFARRRPGTFVLVAAGAGLLVGRLTRALKDAPAQTSSPATPPTPAGSADPYAQERDVTSTSASVPVFPGVQP
jgi:hypothetical protein